MRKVTHYVLLMVLLIFGVSCSKEENVENQLAGTWQQVELSVDGVVVNDEFVAQTYMQFNSNGIMRYYDGETATPTRSGWSFKDDMLNIAIFMPTGFYVDDIGNSSMTLRRVDFQEAKLVTTLSEWKKVDDTLFPEN